MELLLAIAAGWLTLAAVLTGGVARALRMRDERSGPAPTDRPPAPAQPDLALTPAPRPTER